MMMASLGPAWAGVWGSGGALIACSGGGSVGKEEDGAGGVPVSGAAVPAVFAGGGVAGEVFGAVGVAVDFDGAGVTVGPGRKKRK